MKSLACGFVCFLLAISMVHAQGVGTSGEITGTVTDASGAVLLKATVNVIDTQTGLKRTAVTNSTGQFRAAGLSPATYDVSAELTGLCDGDSERRHGRGRANGHLRFPDETVAGRDRYRGNGSAARGGN